MKKFGKWALKIGGTLLLGALSTFIVLALTGIVSVPFIGKNSNAESE